MTRTTDTEAHDRIDDADAPSRFAPLAKLFQDVIDRRLLSGAVSLVWHRGELVHACSQGTMSTTTLAPMALDTIFRLYSLTKPITAAAMMILWDEGRWTPDDPLAMHIPELAELMVGTATEAGELVLSPPTIAPTLEHLMTHQVGFTYGFTPDPVDRAFRAALVPLAPHDIGPADYLARLAKVPLAFQPGAGWRYGVAMDVQGIIIERLSGMSLRTFMKTRLFDALGMVDTDFVLPGDKADRLASLYTLDDSGMNELTGGPFVLPYHPEPVLASGGAGLLSTAPDYLRFGRMLLGQGTLEGQQILSEAAVALMTDTHIARGIVAGGFGASPHHLRPGYEYGYNGVVVTDPAAAGVALGRGTYLWDGAAGTWFWADPENDVVMVAMIQSLADADRLGLQFASREIVAACIGASTQRR